MDYSFIRLLPDFEQAKRNENSPISTLLYTGMVQMLPNETFTQITSVNGGISLLGSLVAELTDSCGNIVLDLTGYFYYEPFTDQNGDEQIKFEFGMIGQDFYTLPLYLKLTDLGNNVSYYSNPFIVTHLDSYKSSRFDYTNNGTIYNIDYPTAQVIQSIRIANCYEHTPVNKQEFKQYTQANGGLISYRNTTTFMRKNILEYCDNFTNDRLCALFSHSIVYLNGERVTVTDYKTDDRKGDTNFFSADYTTSKTGEMFLWDFQLFEPLRMTAYDITNGGIYSNTYLPTPIQEMFFNRNISIDTTKKASIYLGNTLIDESTLDVSANPNSVMLFFNSFNSPYANGTYRLVFPNDAVRSGIIYFDGYKDNEFTFTIQNADYDGTDYDNTEYIV